MTSIVLLVPPNKGHYVRDTYYGCWHKRKFVNYSWPPLTHYHLHALIPGSIVVDAPVHNLDEEATIRKLASLNPDTVVTSVGTFTAAEDGPFLNRIGKELGCRTVLFGEFATTNTRAARRLSDVVIKGEPEAVFPGLLQKLPKLGAGCVIDAGAVNNLDELPFPKRTLEEKNLYFNPFARRGPFATVLASRGCPFECIFCSVPAVYGRSFRVRSVKNVLEELVILRERGFREVFFRDENLTLNKRFLTTFCKGIINRGIGIQWMANSRVDTVDEQSLALMRDAGCHLLKFGVESFSDATLRRIKKGTTGDDARKAISLCNKIGIDTVAHMIIGNPTESEKQIKENIGELIRVEPTYASFDVIRTYPRTGLARMVKLGKGTSIQTERLEWIHNYAFRRFYLRPRLLFKHMRQLGSAHEFTGKARATLQLWGGLLRPKQKT